MTLSKLGNYSRRGVDIFGWGQNFLELFCLKNFVLTYEQFIWKHSSRPKKGSVVECSRGCLPDTYQQIPCYPEWPWHLGMGRQTSRHGILCTSCNLWCPNLKFRGVFSLTLTRLCFALSKIHVRIIKGLLNTVLSICMAFLRTKWTVWRVGW